MIPQHGPNLPLWTAKAAKPEQIGQMRLARIMMTMTLVFGRAVKETASIHCLQAIKLVHERHQGWSRHRGWKQGREYRIVEMVEMKVNGRNQMVQNFGRDDRAG